jgi:hypothetical protein
MQPMERPDVQDFTLPVAMLGMAKLDIDGLKAAYDDIETI